MTALAACYSTPQVGLVQYALPLVALVVWCHNSKPVITQRFDSRS
jgi:hypothetical protein